MNHHFRNLVRVVIRVVIISQGAPCEKGEVHIWSFLFWSLECKEKRVVYIDYLYPTAPCFDSPAVLLIGYVKTSWP